MRRAGRWNATRSLLDVMRRRTIPFLVLIAAASCGDTRGRTHRTFERNIYEEATKNGISTVAASAVPLVYVPNSHSASVSIIDPQTYRVIRTFPVGGIPQHVVPSWDLRQLWVLANRDSKVIPIDPVTGREGDAVEVDAPYNMYYTPDGRYALVIAERLRRIDYRDPNTMELIQEVPVPCNGVDHVEFTLDNRFLVATCEFAGRLIKFDIDRRKTVKILDLGSPERFMPQDIRASPDGRVFYVADMKANGLHVIDPVKLRRVGFIPTGLGTHGIVPSRDGRYMYITNRGWNTLAAGENGPGSISVLDPATDSVIAVWPLPGGGSPDMGNLSADGRELWVSGRYDSEVYVFDTETGRLKHRIPVEKQPHGLAVWPQPGRYSLGHTGNMR